MGTGANISSNLKDGETIKITGLPYNATVQVTESNNTPDNYMMLKNAVAEATDVRDNFTDFNHDEETVAAYDIAIFNNGEEYQPENSPITVTIRDEAIARALELRKSLSLWHILDNGEREEVPFTIENGDIVFSATGFSSYIITETKLTETIQASDGNTYEINVTYQNTAGIHMEGTALSVQEITPDKTDFGFYLDESARTAGTDTDHIGMSRFFDIKVVDAEDHSRIYEPAGDVDVSIRLIGSTLTDYADIHVMHFTEDKTVTEMEPKVTGDTVRFTTDSFSVYAVEGTVRVRTYHFYTLNEYLEYVEYELESDTGEKVYGQTVKSGERPVAPQNPVNPQDEGATFSGWYVGSASTDNPGLGNIPYDFDQIISLDMDDVVHLYAKFSHYAYAIFHDQYDAASETFPVAFTRRVDLENGSESDWYIDLRQYSVSYAGRSNNAFARVMK